MAVPLPILDTLPNQPSVASKVQGWLVSGAQYAGSIGTFTTSVAVAGTTSTATATGIIDPSGALVSSLITTTIGQYTMVLTVGTLAVASCMFNVAA